MQNGMKPLPRAFSEGVATYDVIVVGAGYPGLVTGAILSRNGLRTVIVDELDQIGGGWGNTLHNGYWLEWGHRDAKDTYADPYIATGTMAQYCIKAGKAAGADIAWVGPMQPIVLVHRMSDGKTVTWDTDPEALMEYAEIVYDLPKEKVARFFSVLESLSKEDPRKFMDVKMGEWLPANVEKDLHPAFYRNADIFFAKPLEESSVGRWIEALRDPVQAYAINDPEVGGQQGMMEAFARVIRKYWGEIKLNLQTFEICLKGNKVTGVAARDRTKTVQEFHAPVVVFSHPIWDVFKVLDEKHFPQDIVQNAQKVKEAYMGGKQAILNIGISRLPTIRATGQTDRHMGWDQFSDVTDGWKIPSLSSERQAPKGKHYIYANLCSPGAPNSKPWNTFEEAKERLQGYYRQMCQYYSDLEEITESISYQWFDSWPTSGYFSPTPRSPIQIDGLEGLYFVGQTVEVDGMYTDVEANSALQATELILQRYKVSGRDR